MYARVDSPSINAPYSLKTWMGVAGENRPLILCEYAHDMGNSLEDLGSTGKLFEKLTDCKVDSSGIGWIKVY